MRVAEHLATQETEPPSQQDKEFDKKLRLQKIMIVACVDMLSSLDYRKNPIHGKDSINIEYHIRAANDVSFTGCSTVYSFVPISQGAERFSRIMSQA